MTHFKREAILSSVSTITADSKVSIVCKLYCPLYMRGVGKMRRQQQVKRRDQVTENSDHRPDGSLL